ncbi:MAG: PAC2 family protein [Chloroflexota bacterium]
MEGLIVEEVPELRNPYLLFAFRGWPDAAEAASGAVRYLIRKLEAKRFAEIDPEKFFDFSVVRPMTSVVSPYQREIRWPSNRFYYWKNELGQRDFMFFLGIEPNLMWRTFASGILDLAQQCGADTLLGLGALLDNVPHTRDIKLSGSGNSQEVVAHLESLGVYSSNYQGPTGIHSALYEACQKRTVPMLSLWGHSPHYVQGIGNPKVSYALLAKLKQLLGLEFNLEDLRLASVSFQEEIDKVLATQPEIQSYVRHLEEQYDGQEGTALDIPSPEALVKELEAFLRKQRKDLDDKP